MRHGNLQASPLGKQVCCCVLWAVALVGCASNGETEATTDLTYCDAQVVIADKCVRCHSEDGDVETPFSLTSYDDVSERVTSIVRVIKNGSMPFVDRNLDPAVEPLTDAEKALLLEWLEAGAPEGDGPCE